MAEVIDLLQDTTYPAYLSTLWKLHTAKREANAPTVISTFAGTGGSSLGYSMAGFRELLAVEWDDNAVETFKLNFPNVPVHHGNIKELSADQCLTLAGIKSGKLDLFDGSPPCQGFSTMGSRKFADPKNELYMDYARLLQGLQPKVFVMENVSGMVKGKMRLIFVDILHALKGAGYQVSARLLNAMWFGVPQMRQRLIFIGVRNDLGITPTHPIPQTKPITARQAWAGLSEKVQDASTDHVWVDEVARKTVGAARALITRPGEKIVKRAGAVTIRTHYDRPMYTVTTAGNSLAPYISNSSLHPTQMRTNSIRESARGTSFPDEYKFVDPIRNGIARIGNCVPPLLMYAIAKHIKANVLDKCNADEAA